MESSHHIRIDVSLGSEEVSTRKIVEYEIFRLFEYEIICFEYNIGVCICLKKDMILLNTEFRSF